MQWGCIRSGWGSSDATNMHEHPLHEQIINVNGICTLPKACQITSDALLTSTLSFFDLFLKHLQSKPTTQTTIIELFLETRAMDTNSNNISSSSFCFLFEKCARERAVREPRAMAIATCLNQGTPFFVF
jgi:hypothetical protein